MASVPMRSKIPQRDGAISKIYVNNSHLSQNSVKVMRQKSRAMSSKHLCGDVPRLGSDGWIIGFTLDEPITRNYIRRIGRKAFKIKARDCTQRPSHHIHQSSQEFLLHNVPSSRPNRRYCLRRATFHVSCLMSLVSRHRLSTLRAGFGSKGSIAKKDLILLALKIYII